MGANNSTLSDTSDEKYILQYDTRKMINELEKLNKYNIKKANDYNEMLKKNLDYKVLSRLRKVYSSINKNIPESEEDDIFEKVHGEIMDRINNDIEKWRINNNVTDADIERKISFRHDNCNQYKYYDGRWSRMISKFKESDYDTIQKGGQISVSHYDYLIVEYLDYYRGYYTKRVNEIINKMINNDIDTGKYDNIMKNRLNNLTKGYSRQTTEKSDTKREPSNRQTSRRVPKSEPSLNPGERK